MTASTDLTIGFDRPCVTCGYNLRGLQPAGLCPECGSLVSDSLGNEALEWRDERWVKKLRRGCVLILGGQIPLVVALLSGPDRLRGRLVVIWAIALCAAGAWLVSSAGRGLDAYRRLRLGVRLTCVAPVAAAIVYPLVIPLLWPACICFTFKTLAALASRRGARSWANTAGFVAWNLAGSLFLVGLVMGIAISSGGEGAGAAVTCFLLLIAPWMLVAYVGALAVLIRFAIGLRKE